MRKEHRVKVLVTGAGGMLGTDLCSDLAARGHQVIATDVREPFEPLDICDTGTVRRAFAERRPDAVIHCAAWTDVDGAERNPDGAYRVNALGSWNIAAACAECDATLLHVSTDFVFDGNKPGGAPYDEWDATNPLGHYARSKEIAERLVRQTLPGRHIIARTAWLYGVHGKNLAYAILNAAKPGPN
jgi:dTDP-4-dehydrorhamnose reductase